jgi:uncharacterized protein (DUF885 family)
VTRIDELADRYVDEWAALSPIGATHAGIPGHDTELDDLSPDGFAARADLARRTLRELRTAEPVGERERVAREAMAERLGLELEMYDTGETTSQLNVIDSPLHGVRQVFDLTPTEGEEAVSTIAARLAAIPDALAQFRVTLLEAATDGRATSQHQVTEVANQCDRWIDPDGDDVFRGLSRRLTATGSLRAELDRAVDATNEAIGEFAAFLREELAPHAREKDAVGRERYELASRYFLGATVDLDETYAWGFAELARLEAEMRSVATRIAGPEATVEQAVTALEADANRIVGSKEAFRHWMQDLADEAISDLHGVHFDIPEQVRRIEARIAPTSDGGVYYTAPSEDFSRAGHIWWAVPQGVTSFSTWRDVTTVYHEGVPGHHLQIAQTMVRADLLNRWQRLLCWVSGHGEGWALYAERLMDDLGYLEDAGNKLGMLDAQAFRACRVVVDIGMHLELEIPRDNPIGFHPGERWTPELGWEFLRGHCRLKDEELRFELDRYLGWPGQAPSYKVGERIWLAARDDARSRTGAGFDLKQFHQNALNLGPLGLDPLRQALARL